MGSNVEIADKERLKANTKWVADTLDTDHRVFHEFGTGAGMQAKNLEVQANKTAWLPQIDLIAQYGLFSKFNNYDVYFNRFQRNNAQIGVSPTALKL